MLPKPIVLLQYHVGSLGKIGSKADTATAYPVVFPGKNTLAQRSVKGLKKNVS